MFSWKKSANGPVLLLKARSSGLPRLHWPHFGERLSETERSNLASQLPRELKDVLQSLSRPADYGIDEYYNLVASRADIEREKAVRFARATMMVLREAVTGGELTDMVADLPPEFGELFGKEPIEPLQPSP